MDRHCVNSKAADQYAHQCGQEDDRELAIERLELEWFEALEVCIRQSGNPQLMHFLDGYSDTISQLLNSMARRHLTT